MTEALKPAEAPAAAPAKDSFDDLFGEPAPAAPATDPAPAADTAEPLPEPTDEVKPADEAKPAPTDDPFGDPFKISAEGQLPMRAWVDNTGTFKIQGRLIAILDGKVRLLKDTGKTTTVPLNRLSAADREYVDQVVERNGSDVLKQLAAR